jgi:hypothetical protein
MRMLLLLLPALALGQADGDKAANKSTKSLYQVKASVAPSPIAVGEKARVQVRFQLAPEAHISQEAPLTLKFEGPSGLSFERAVLHYADAKEPGTGAPSFEDAVQAQSPGEQEFKVVMSFYVCTATLCNHEKETQTLKLAVK